MAGRGVYIGTPGRWARLCNRLGRLRHFRGHGVHSPYVYAIVREVFMRRDLLPGDRTLFRALRERGVGERTACELQNLAIHCGCTSCAFDCGDADFVVLIPGLPHAETIAVVCKAAARGGCVALLAPYATAERQHLCRLLVEAHRSTTVDKRAYLLFFNNHLPKQHFEL